MAGRLEALSAAVLRAGGTRRAVEIVLDAVEGRAAPGRASTDGHAASPLHGETTPLASGPQMPLEGKASVGATLDRTGPAGARAPAVEQA